MRKIFKNCYIFSFIAALVFFYNVSSHACYSATPPPFHGSSITTTCMPVISFFEYNSCDVIRVMSIHKEENDRMDGEDDDDVVLLNNEGCRLNKIRLYD